MDKESNDAKFTIEGNPGQNNTFINIGTAYNVNPNATKVENTFIIGSREEGNTAMAEAMGGKKISQMTLREMLKKGMVGKVMTKDFDQLDEKIGLILDLQSGNPLKIFPRKIDSLIVWETPSTVFKGGMQEFVARVNESTDANYVKYNKFHNKYPFFE